MFDDVMQHAKLNFLAYVFLNLGCLIRYYFYFGWWQNAKKATSRRKIIKTVTVTTFSLSSLLLKE